MNDFMTEDPGGTDGNDRDLGALLRGVGPRPLPPPEIVADIRTAVAAEWRGSVLAERRNARRRNTGWLAAAASIAGAGLLAWFLVPQPGLPPVEVAAVSRAVGPVSVAAGESAHRLAAGEPVLAGSTVETGAGGRVALRFSDDVQLRLDERTRLVVASTGQVRLERGQLYFDSGPSSRAATDFTVDTPFGAARHLGTQYQLAVGRGALLVSVREGRVLMIPPAGSGLEVAAGEQVRVARDGRIARGRVAPTAGAWDWIHAVTPGFDIEQRPLSAFVAWVARETGRELVYSGEGLATAASRVTLRGSVAGLTPDAALETVLATTDYAAVADSDRITLRRRD